jgi:hypothetical protein
MESCGSDSMDENLTGRFTTRVGIQFSRILRSGLLDVYDAREGLTT